MKAFVLRSYGSPDVLDLTDIDKPVPARRRGAGPGAGHLRQPVRLAHHERRAVHRASDAAASGCATRSSTSWAPTWPARSRRSART